MEGALKVALALLWEGALKQALALLAQVLLRQTALFVYCTLCRAIAAVPRLARGKEEAKQWLAHSETQGAQGQE